MSCLTAIVSGSMVAGAVRAGPVDTLQPGHWYEFPNSRLDSVAAADDPAANPNYPGTPPYQGVEGVSAVLADWCGAAFNSRDNELIAWCGGHAGYAGNEIYVFNVAQGQWSRETNPYYAAGVSAANWCSPPHSLNPDGSPAIVHTYDYVEYNPVANEFIVLGGGQAFPGGSNGCGSTRSVRAYNFTTGQWRLGATRGGDRGMTSSSSGWDPNRRVIWWLPAGVGYLHAYDPIADTWTQHTRSTLPSDHTSAVDPERDLLVTLEGRDNGEVLVHDLKNPAARYVAVNIAGDQTLLTVKAAGFEWDPVVKKFVGWNALTDRAAVYTLTPPAGDWRTQTWMWQRVGPAPGNTVIPTERASTKTYSKWRYMPAYNAYILVNRTNENVFAYKLSAG
ncbi:MAG: hypothetical protein ACE5G3_04890, partial [Gammaproteobacteria bacterium]